MTRPNFHDKDGALSSINNTMLPISMGVFFVPFGLLLC
jgi:hypothetical protein